MSKFSPSHRPGASFPKPAFQRPSFPKPSLPKQPVFRPPAFRPAISKPALRPPLDFHKKPPTPRQWTTHFDKQSQVSRGFGNVSTALPKWLPKPIAAPRLGAGKPVRAFNVPKAIRNINAAIDTQRRIVAHQKNVGRTLDRTLAALKGPKFTTRFPTASGPVAPTNKRLAEAIRNSNAVQKAAKAGVANLERQKKGLQGNRALKPTPAAHFKKQDQLHRVQATLLGRVGKALGRLFKLAPPVTDRKAPAVATVMGGGQGSATQSLKQQHGARTPPGARPQRSTTRDPFAPQPVRLTPNSTARRMFLAGQRRYDAGDYPGAQSNWESALGDAGPAQSAPLRYNIALAHLRQDHADRVEEAYYELIRDGHPELAARLQQLRTQGLSANSPASRPPIVGMNAQARLLFEAGQRRYDAGDHAGARSDWNTALDMAEPAARPILRFDIGLTHLRQGNDSRVDEIAAELIRDGHVDLAGQLQQLRGGP